MDQWWVLKEIVRSLFKHYLPLNSVINDKNYLTSCKIPAKHANSANPPVKHPNTICTVSRSLNMWTKYGSTSATGAAIKGNLFKAQ